MSKNRTYMIFAALTALSLGACSRPATSTGATPTQDEISAIFTVAETLTAQAPGNDGEDGEDDIDPFAPTSTTTPPVITATATEKATAAATEPQTVPNKYTLKKREYPYCIARRFNVDIEALMSKNGLSSSSVYVEGLELSIPQNAGKFSGKRKLISHPTDYTVQAGDTLFWIACKFGDVYPQAIAQANEIGVKAKLTTGDVLKIP